MKCIIIDDEAKARSLLRILIEENCPEISQIFEAPDLLSGIKLIKEQNPKIVFLDIEMPEHSGLEILEFFKDEKVNFEIIFTTAYNEYALQAFQISAVDYLLKPLRPIQVKEAVAKALTFIGNSQMNEKIETLKKALFEEDFNKIGLPVTDGIKFLPTSEIILLEADGMYTKFFTKAECILVSKPLKHFVALLESKKTFYRPHRSYLINLKYIKQYVKSDGGYIILENDHQVSISQNKKEEFLKLVNGI